MLQFDVHFILFILFYFIFYFNFIFFFIFVFFKFDHRKYFFNKEVLHTSCYYVLFLVHTRSTRKLRNELVGSTSTEFVIPFYFNL